MVWYAAVAPRAAAAEPGDLLEEIMLRARVTAMAPRDRVRIHWVMGGWGLTAGVPVLGEITRMKVGTPNLPEIGKEDKNAGDLLDEAPQDPDILIEHGKTFDYQWLKVGVWSQEVPLSTFRGGGFVTIQAHGQKIGTASTNVVMEFEIRHKGKTLRTFSERGPDGPTVGIFLPFKELRDQSAPTPEFLNGCNGLEGYVSNKVVGLESLPWASDPLPVRYAVFSDCGGYGRGAGYGIRTTNPQLMFLEARAMRLMGMNGFRNISPPMALAIEKGEGIGKEFRRVRDNQAGGYPVVTMPNLQPWQDLDPDAGCPYNEKAKALQAAQPERHRQIAAEVAKLPVEEWWGITVDEIGSVWNSAAEGKAHMGSCPLCREAFRDYLKEHGLTPESFGATNWADIRSTFGYWSKTYRETQKDRADAQAAALPKAKIEAAKTGADMDDQTKDVLDEIAKAPGRDEPAADRPVAGSNADSDRPRIEGREVPFTKPGLALLSYYSARFLNEGSARLFTEKEKFFRAQNEAKRQALAEGRTDTPEARQPWMYSYALRGNNFLMGGSSLDFFDFYRLADNGFMYETSNRDPRVWQWDSYLCDVGRILVEKNLVERFGIVLKPHRGAGIQRALAACARDMKALYWYTYGPEWAKGDCFGGNSVYRAAVSRADRLIAAAEEVIYDGRPVPARVAVVRPFTSGVFENSASWENGKWVYTALMNAHLRVDPLDEGLLLSEDLSRYAAVYVSGSHIRKDAAAKLAAYVEQGGVLVTSGGGLARDERDESLKELDKVFGLRARQPAELWAQVPRYGSTSLGYLAPGDKAPGAGADQLEGKAPFAGRVQVRVGRETLDPEAGAEILARFGDGKAAAVRNRHGKGWAYVLGFYAGLEYGSDLMKDDFDMSTDMDPVKRAWVAQPALLAGAAPVVELSHPMCDAILLRNEPIKKSAVILINWSYRSRSVAAADANPPPAAPFRDSRFVPAESVKVAIRGVGRVVSVRSCWNRTSVPFEQKGEDVVLTLPLLEEAEVLVLDQGGS
jgi:hypothetical protein